MLFHDAFRDWRAAESRALVTAKAVHEDMVSKRVPLPLEAAMELHEQWRHANLLLKVMLAQAAANAYMLRQDKR